MAMETPRSSSSRRPDGWAAPVREAPAAAVPNGHRSDSAAEAHWDGPGVPGDEKSVVSWPTAREFWIVYKKLGVF